MPLLRFPTSNHSINTRSYASGFFGDLRGLCHPLFPVFSAGVLCSACSGFFSWRERISGGLRKIAALFWKANVSPFFFGPNMKSIGGGFRPHIAAPSFFVELNGVLHGPCRKFSHFVNGSGLASFPQSFVGTLGGFHVTSLAEGEMKGDCRTCVNPNIVLI